MSNPIQWYPGHMTVSKRNLTEQIKQCDVIIYVLDARCPKSCLNPDFEEFCLRKPVIFYHSKSDLAPDKRGSHASQMERPAKLNEIQPRIAKLFPNKRIIRAMVIGVPNSGKSTLINKLSRAKKTLTGDKPGITRHNQWVAASDNLWLLDTPGILWPKFEIEQVAKNLAYIGTIKDDVVDSIELAQELLKDIEKLKGKKLDLHEFCKSRGYLLQGGRVDELRGARSILFEFRAGKMGKYNLDELL